MMNPPFKNLEVKSIFEHHPYLFGPKTNSEGVEFGGEQI